MKLTIFRNFFLALAMLLGLASCEDRELITAESQSAPILIDLSAENIVLDKNFPTNPVLTVTWQQATYNVPVELKYILQISADESFAEPQQLMTTDQSKRYFTFTTYEMNEAAKRIGLVPFEAQKMYFRVVAYLGEGSLSQTSNITSLTLTPYTASPTYDYTDLYLIGSSTAAEWDNSAGNVNLYPLLKDASNDSKYTYTGYFKSSGTDGGFKMIKIKGSWDEQYGLGASAGSLSTEGGSGNIPVPADGYYTLTVNITDLTYTLEPAETPSTTYNSVSIIGTVNGNWDTDTELTQSTFDPHVWYVTGLKLSAGEFKFRANGAWDVSWGTNAEFFGTATQGGANIPLSSEWTYDIYFNDSTGAYTVIPVK